MSRFRVQDYFHIYWSKSKILFYACIEDGRSASLTIARGNKLEIHFIIRWS